VRPLLSAITLATLLLATGCDGEGGESSDATVATPQETEATSPTPTQSPEPRVDPVQAATPSPPPIALHYVRQGATETGDGRFVAFRVEGVDVDSLDQEQLPNLFRWHSELEVTGYALTPALNEIVVTLAPDSTGDEHSVTLRLADGRETTASVLLEAAPEFVATPSMPTATANATPVAATTPTPAPTPVATAGPAAPGSLAELPAFAVYHAGVGTCQFLVTRFAASAFASSVGGAGMLLFFGAEPQKGGPPIFVEADSSSPLGRTVVSYGMHIDGGVPTVSVMPGCGGGDWPMTHLGNGADVLQTSLRDIAEALGLPAGTLQFTATGIESYEDTYGFAFTQATKVSLLGSAPGPTVIVLQTVPGKPALQELRTDWSIHSSIEQACSQNVVSGFEARFTIEFVGLGVAAGVSARSENWAATPSASLPPTLGTPVNRAAAMTQPYAFEAFGGTVDNPNCTPGRAAQQTLVLQFADGAEIHAQVVRGAAYEYQSEGGLLSERIAEFRIFGGTGRFANASGEFTLHSSSQSGVPLSSELTNGRLEY